MTEVQATGTEPSPSKALAVRSSSDMNAIEELEALLVSNERMPEDDYTAEDIATEMVKQLLAAESDEELEQFGEATGWSELLGVPIELDGFRWRPSAFDEPGSSSLFFVVNGTRLDTSERVVLTCGSRTVMAQLANMAKRGTLTGAIRECVQADKPTRAGFKPLQLRTPAKAAKA